MCVREREREEISSRDSSSGIRDPLRVSASYAFDLAHTSLVARGTLDRDGGLAKGDFVGDLLLLLLLVFGGCLGDVVHCGLHCVCRLGGLRGRGDGVQRTDRGCLAFDAKMKSLEIRTCPTCKGP